MLLLLSVTAAYAEQAIEPLSHDLFQDVLTAYVDDGDVNYPGISADSSYHSYISDLQKPVRFQNSNEELSYWINAYNALAIKGILDGRSPESFFGKIGYFYNAEYTVNGITTNLYDLEHDVIIPLGEPRIHFALNCASASCPKLSGTVYQEDTLEQQLEDAAIMFINDSSRNRFDHQAKIAYISKIFDWFEDDFVKHSATVQNYLALYVNDQQVSTALANNEYEIEYMEYDWSLNGIPPTVTADE
ncbi:MAG: DUF547 domain-containing protein [Gammaproteobacteria bacterium]|nr:DUF547 domain-containing protein [Gammaproteobacteria bacterium]MBT8133744.1 DUF547 domain-containing protein [Gammaproteobacteria bacterium]NNJ49974.1 DUF547 domain-containing protein [Gammaproteobacteria bacterium]